MMNLKQLCRYAVHRNLQISDLSRAVERLGFVQIDPIRAPAKAHELILRQRVAGYQLGDIDVHYPNLEIEECYFINHGYLARPMAQLLWTGRSGSAFLSSRAHQVKQILTLAGQTAELDSKTLNTYLGSQRVSNAWGGSSQEGTHIVQSMHRNGMLRIVRRHKGQRVYGMPLEQASSATKGQIVSAAFALFAQTYAPFPHASLVYMARLLVNGRADLKETVKQALADAEQYFAHTEINGERWYWPTAENPQDAPAAQDRVAILTPFDPLVWDRYRFELFWGWRYVFEAYKPAQSRQYGYYAMPLFWREQCIGWVNTTTDGVEIGYVNGDAPRSKKFAVELEREVASIQKILEKN